MIKILRELKDSSILINFPRIKKFISLMVDFQVETFEIFNMFVFLFWGFWGIFTSRKFIGPVFNNPYIPAILYVYTGFLIGVFCLISLIGIINSKTLSLKYRKISMLISSMFWSFTVTMFIIYNPYSHALPIYCASMVFCLWVSLRLTSYQYDLKNLNRNQ